MLVKLEDYQRHSLSKSLLGYALKNNLFKLFVPNIYGGEEHTLLDGLEKIYEASKVFGSLGWCVNLGSGAGYFWPFFRSQAASEIFSADNAVIAGSGAITGTAEGAAGGYILNGTWDKCTGSAHATWFTVNAKLNDGSVRSFAIPADKVQITRKWDLFALKATSSEAIDVKSVFVPEYMCFEIESIVNSESNYGIRDLPFYDFARYCMFASLLGIVQCLSDQLRREYEGHDRILPYVQNTDQLIERLKSELLQSADQFYPDPGSGANFDFSKPAHDLYLRASELFYNEGLRLSNEETLSHFAWRDVMLATQHFLLK